MLIAIKIRIFIMPFNPFISFRVSSPSLLNLLYPSSSYFLFSSTASFPYPSYLILHPFPPLHLNVALAPLQPSVFIPCLGLSSLPSLSPLPFLPSLSSLPSLLCLPSLWSLSSLPSLLFLPSSLLYHSSSPFFTWLTLPPSLSSPLPSTPLSSSPLPSTALPMTPLLSLSLPSLPIPPLLSPALAIPPYRSSPLPCQALPSSLLFCPPIPPLPSSHPVDKSCVEYQHSRAVATCQVKNTTARPVGGVYMINSGRRRWCEVIMAWGGGCGGVKVGGGVGGEGVGWLGGRRRGGGSSVPCPRVNKFDWCKFMGLLSACFLGSCGGPWCFIGHWNGDCSCKGKKKKKKCWEDL